MAGHVVFPAVIGTAQPVVLIAADPERGAAMGAELVDQRIAPLRIAPGQQPLGEEFYAYRRTFVFR